MNQDSNIDISEIDDESATLEKRVKAIEQKLEKKVDLVGKTTAYGALFALLISIVTGVYTIYDRTVVSPSEDIYNKKEELRQSADELMRLQDHFVINIAGIKDPLLKEQAVRSVNTRANLKLQRGRELVAELGENVDVGELLVFGYFEASMGNWQGARDLFEFALRTKPESEALLAEIHAQLGQFYMFPGGTQDISKGRAHYEDAQRIYEKRNEPFHMVARIKLGMQWANSEQMIASNISSSCQLLKKAGDVFGALPEYQKITYKDLKAQLNDLTSRIGCALLEGGR